MWDHNPCYQTLVDLQNMAENLHSFEEEISELLPKKNSKNTSWRTTPAICTISICQNISLHNPEFAEEEANEDRKFQLLVKLGIILNE